MVVSESHLGRGDRLTCPLTYPGQILVTPFLGPDAGGLQLIKLAGQLRQPLSVIVPCGNNVDLIEDCLRGVSWADEVVVVASDSSDGTLEIARRYASRILHNEYVDSATQKNWAIPQVAHEWVLIIDTDERVDEKLRDEICALLANPGDCVGFKIPRLNHALGHPLHYGGEYPDYQLRLFRKDKGRYAHRRVHAHVLLDGPVGVCKNHIRHFGQRSIDQVVHHLLGDFTTWEAEERYRQGKRFGIWQALVRPVAAFVYRYFYRQGFRDGIAGLFMSGIWAIYVFVTYLKLWEMEDKSLEGSVADPTPARQGSEYAN